MSREEPSSKEAMELNFLLLDQRRLEAEIAAAGERGDYERRAALSRERAALVQRIAHAERPAGSVYDSASFCLRHLRSCSCMEKELLEECLGEGLSLEAIGERVGKHESTVSYWLKKHGLVAAKAEKSRRLRGDLRSEELEGFLPQAVRLVAKLLETLDRSLATIRYWLGDTGSRPAPTGAKGVRCARGGSTETSSSAGGTELPRSFCEGQWLLPVQALPVGAGVADGGGHKRQLVEEAGGKCLICGYSTGVSRLLQFHHLDPATKEFHLAHRGYSTRPSARSQCRGSQVRAALRQLPRRGGGRNSPRCRCNFGLRRPVRSSSIGIATVRGSSIGRAPTVNR